MNNNSNNMTNVIPSNAQTGNPPPAAGRFLRLFTTKAYIFHVDPETQNKWIQTVKKAIDVSIVVSRLPSLSSTSVTNDGTNGGQINGNSAQPRREFRLYAVNDETGDIVLDDLIMARTTFEKRSQKFCQWMDNNKLLCGLGFDHDEPLKEFLDTINLYQREIVQQEQQQHQQQLYQMDQQTQHLKQSQMKMSNSRAELDLNDSSNQNENGQHGQLFHNNNNNNINNNNNNNIANNQQPQIQQQRQQHHLQQQQQQQQQQQKIHTLDELRYENDKLKRALEETAQNATLWQNELVSLRTNNAKLTQALKESRRNVEDWERELESARDENRELKSQIQVLKSSRDPDDYKRRVDELREQLAAKDDDIEKLEARMEELALQKTEDQMNNNVNSLDKFDKQKLDSIKDELARVLQNYTQVLEKIDQKMTNESGNFKTEVTS